MPKTTFRPQTDGFAFVNNWSFTGDEISQIQRYFMQGVGVAGNSLGQSLGNVVATAAEHLNGVINSSNFNAAHYGLCGGMAYAARDYYKADMLLPRGQSATDLPVGPPDTPAGVLRTFLFQRLLDSLAAGGVAGTLLEWMAMQHLVPMIPFMGSQGGEPWLLERSKEQWAILKAHIDADDPWPIVLLGSTNIPTNNHQVLAYGYDDPGDGTGVIYLYDPNCPHNNDGDKTIQLDFRGTSLQATETCYQAPRGPLRGFFCAKYVAPATPLPIAVAVTATQGAGAQQVVVENVGFCPSPALALAVQGATGGLIQQETLESLASGANKAIGVAAQAASTSNVVVRCFLGTFDGVEVWKNLPIVGSSK